MVIKFILDSSRFVPAPGLRSRFIAFGKFLLFAVLFFALLRFAGWASGFVRVSGVGWQALIGNLGVALAAIVATAILARFERRDFGIYGLGGRAKGWNAGAGVAAGLILLTALLLAIRLVSSFRFGTLSSGQWIQYGTLYAALFAAVALAEETLWRGYALVQLSQSISFWPAAVVLSVIFGVTHLNHAEENVSGIVFACIFGMVLAWSFRETGSLWFAMGIHAGWDYAQSFIYGVPDSGVVLPGALLRPQVGGPKWLTGGSAGPEASMLMLLVFVALVYTVRRFKRVTTF
jgi:hypothetical protein